MSKKTRKKSSKTPSRKASKPSAKKSGTAASRTATKTSAKKSVKQPATASHKAPSKKLNVNAPQKSALVVAGTRVAKPTPATPSGQNPPDPNLAAAPGKAVLLSEGAQAPAFKLPRDAETA